jgi:phospholipid N-methyltransferase
MKMFKKLKNSGISEFAKELVNNPGHVGAALPSSKYLASAMAKLIPLDKPGFVIELGGGTGAVTDALLKHGISETQLVVIERSAALASHLRKRFPNVLVIEGDASELRKLIGDKTPIIAIVSSLPLRSLPDELVAAISHEFDELLQTGGILIQYTYSFKQDPGHHSQHLKKVFSKQVWLNIPPARVEVFQYTAP